MKKKLIIFGLSNIAECAYEYFMRDSDYKVVAFTVDTAYIKKEEETKFDLPIIPFENLEQHLSPEEHSVFIAIGSQKLNRLRTKKVAEVRAQGYQLASYISSRAFIWPNVEIGEHAFIQEDNTIQPFVRIGNNVTIWAGNHIGHATTIEDNCFIASHSVISGHCHIGKNTFVGINASIADNIKIGCDNFIGMSTNIATKTEDDSVFKASKSELSKVGAKRLNRVVK